jgi:hypothetical protein
MIKDLILTLTPSYFTVTRATHKCALTQGFGFVKVSISVMGFQAESQLRTSELVI